MKNIFKRLLLVMCVLTMAFAMTACGGPDESINYVDEEVTAKSTQVVEGLLLPDFNADYLKIYENQMDDEAFEFYSKTAESWQKAYSETGSITVNSVENSSDDENVTSLVKVTGETGKTAEVEIIYDKRLNPTSITVNVDRTFGENMANAGLNTLLGMGTVFVVLILIAFIISLFKYIGVVEKMMKAKSAPANADKKEPVDKALAQIDAREAQQDDTELIAVISAAIAAYEESNGGSGDGYVVRSIKRRA